MWQRCRLRIFLSWFELVCLSQITVLRLLCPKTYLDMGIKKQPDLYKSLWSYDTSSFLLEAKFVKKKIFKQNVWILNLRIPNRVQESLKGKLVIYIVFHKWKFFKTNTKIQVLAKKYFCPDKIISKILLKCSLISLRECRILNRFQQASYLKQDLPPPW